MVHAEIQWKDSPLEVSAEARREGKLVLLFLFDPDCAGCQRMEKVTFAHPCVAEYIEHHFAPVRMNAAADVSLFERYNCFWTPTLIVQDSEAHECRRTEGFLPPECFVAEMALARLKDALNRHQFERALELAPETRRHLEGDKYREPEGFYWSGVAEYKASKNVEPLKNWWTRLLEEFPESEWAKRAEVIR
ncbi:MAG TPA: thioredoxin family protein [Planctomycetota bacterium]|nr:thioredoxin family protein [Planctomycetota bacterium]